MEYKDYKAIIEFDEDAELFHGEVITTKDVITFQGASVEDLKQAFADSVDDYLSWCEERGEEPDKAFSGKFNLRISPETHRELTYLAREQNKSLNNFIAEKLEDAIV